MSVTDTPVPSVAGNSPEARTGTGELKDQGTPTPISSTPPEPKPAPTSLLDGAAPPPSTVPEKYTFSVPDGFVIDEKVNAEASEVFRSLKLDNAQAQSLMDLYIKHTQEANEAPFKAYADLRETWQNAVAADPVIGDGKGLQPKVRETIGRAFDSLGNPKLVEDFKEAMNITGAGDNPAFIKAFYTWAQKITEGRPVSGASPSPAGQQAPDARPRTHAQAIYPNLPSGNR